MPSFFASTETQKARFMGGLLTYVSQIDKIAFFALLLQGTFSLFHFFANGPLYLCP
ncbi:hypothetical protein ALQ33_200150 [Pseudomonas syringae pv. philadelphi]|uniref:Uncharacterized protein n=1 Tax=Pseudomonas syringae pv. philadelphi TaxID=251706 RepID=A0A3M3YCE9_9PSED|nr:hypothetical protein ALQ33_200150 [Pseudomonas syringae pv. philadelphi]